jgi:glycosyltransferase involved in cell wall biosynthesis
MHIAFVTGEYPPQPGGVGDYTRCLALALIERSHRVSVLTIADDYLQVIDPSQPAQPQRVRFTDWGWSSWRSVIEALDMVRPEVLHIQYQTGAYGMRPAINLLPWRLKRLPTYPRIAVTAHDLLLPYLFPKAGPVRTWVTKRLLLDSDGVVVTNQADLAGANRYGVTSPALIPIGSNIAVAPPADYDRAAWRAQLGVADDEVLVAYFGLISSSKGVHTLLDALERLPKRVRLLVVGGAATQPQDRAYAAEIEQRIAERGLGERVRITGHCDESSVSAHLLAADLAALPFTDGASFRRGSLLAALAHGLPVVTTASAPTPSVPGVPSLLDGVNTLLVPPEQPEALAQALERLMNDQLLRQRVAEGGRALAGQFSWESIAAQHEQFYGQLLR